MTPEEEYELYADPKNQEPTDEPRRRLTSSWYELDALTDEESYPHQFDTREEERGER